MAELNQIDVATKRYIRNTPKLIDMVFQEGPVVAYAKQNVREDYDGGRFIGENFYYNGLIGGPYLKGKNFDISQPQVEQQLQFNVKFFEMGVTLYKEDIQVINKGPNAAFRLIESRMTNAYMTVGAQLEIGMFLNGQDAGYTANFNGLTEACNDNTVTNWNGNAYSTYGTITRGGAVGTTLNSAATNVGGTIEYNTNDPIATTFINQMSGGALTAYPTITSETLWWLNARKPYFNFYISDDPEYGFGFTGFKPAQGNTVVVGQILFSGAVTFAPRYHRQLYGITG